MMRQFTLYSNRLRNKTRNCGKEKEACTAERGELVNVRCKMNIIVTRNEPQMQRCV